MISPEVGVVEFHNATVLLEGWCVLTDSGTGEGTAVVSPKDVFNVAWLRLNQLAWLPCETR